MTDRPELAEVLDLVGRALRQLDERVPKSATPAELAVQERRLGFPLPADLRDWLSACRGGCPAGPSVLFGVGMHEDSIASVLDIFPEWRARRWIPITTDGCGNYYVIDATRQYADTDAVYFIDTMETKDAFGYVVGSTLIRFLRFLLEDELGAKGWPFDADYVLARDPALAEFREPTLLPWNA